jgi:hypothetical protein
MAEPVPRQFTAEGLLPPCDYLLSLSELHDSFLVRGPDERELCPLWDVAWRSHLVDNLGIMVRQLWQVGITEIFVNGSFVEAKEHPNDIDGYFECELLRLARGELERELNLLDPYKS